MNRIYLVFIFLSVFIASFFLNYIFLFSELPKGDPLGIFVGVDVGYDNIEEIKQLVDEISSYTNTFVIGSTGITYNISKLNEVCEYVYDRGMYFLIYMHPKTEYLDQQRQWVKDARTEWGQHFLGLYAFDEPGGRQLDRNEPLVFYEVVANYTDAADKYVISLKEILRHIKEYSINSGNLTLFTSDYGLYWFDYKAGYDTVFAEFGWNYSRKLNVALNRGAATVQNKDWGVMITWTYNNPPYIESGTELYQDMILAYNNGAKYILIFDANKNYTQGILKEEHLEALKQFWNYTKNNPRATEPLSERVAYVLPKDYGYGFRGPDDKNWGLWEADSLSYEISQNLGSLLEEYGTKLDIIYDDGLEPNNTYGYNKLVFWNGTVYEP